MLCFLGLSLRLGKGRGPFSFSIQIHFFSPPSIQRFKEKSPLPTTGCSLPDSVGCISVASSSMWVSPSIPAVLLICILGIIIVLVKCPVPVQSAWGAV